MTTVSDRELARRVAAAAAQHSRQRHRAERIAAEADRRELITRARATVSRWHERYGVPALREPQPADLDEQGPPETAGPT
jgi:hypothetical protein